MDDSVTSYHFRREKGHLSTLQKKTLSRHDEWLESPEDRALHFCNGGGEIPAETSLNLRREES